MAETTVLEEARKRGTAKWIQQRRNDPEKMKRWLRAMRLGRLRKARELKRAASQKKEVTVAKRKNGRGQWMKDPKRARAAALKGHLTRKRKRLARAREQSAREVQRNVVAHHSPDDLVHLEFPIVAGGPTRATSGGYDGLDLTQLTPQVRKQLALEGLRFVKILLE